jgi:hypothetical protein
MIAQSATQQNQRGEKEQIGIHYPLYLHAGRLEFRLKPGQEDIHDSRVNKHHARTENSSGQHSISSIDDVFQANWSLTQENKAARQRSNRSAVRLPLIPLAP